MTNSTQSLVLDAIVAGIEARDLTAAIDRKFSNYGMLTAYDDLDPVFTLAFIFEGSGGHVARNVSVELVRTAEREDRAWIGGAGLTPRGLVDQVLSWLDEARRARAEAAQPDPARVTKGSRWRLDRSYGDVDAGEIVTVLEPMTGPQHQTLVERAAGLPARVIGRGLPSYATPVYRDVQFAPLLDVSIDHEGNVVQVRWDWGSSSNGEFDPVTYKHKMETEASGIAEAWIDRRRGVIDRALTPTTIADPQEPAPC